MQNDSLKVDAPLIDYGTTRDYIIRNIEVHGANFMNHQSLIGTAGLEEGASITLPGGTISNAINKIWGMRRFTDVDIVAEPIADSVDLHIYLEEHPRVHHWYFEGIRKGEMTTLKDKMNLNQGSELSDYVIEKHTNYIKNHYIQKGFRNVEVPPHRWPHIPWGQCRVQFSCPPGLLHIFAQWAYGSARRLK